MAGPITWRNVAAPSYGEAMQGMNQAGTYFDKAFTNIENIGQGFVEQEQSRVQEQKEQDFLGLTLQIDEGLGSEIDFEEVGRNLGAEAALNLKSYSDQRETREIATNIQRMQAELTENDLIGRKAIAQNSSRIFDIQARFAQGTLSTEDFKKEFDSLVADGVPVGALADMAQNFFRDTREREEAIRRANLYQPINELINSVSLGTSATSAEAAIVRYMNENPDFKMLAATDPENFGLEAVMKRLRNAEQNYNDLGTSGQAVYNERVAEIQAAVRQAHNDLDVEVENIIKNTVFQERPELVNFFDRVNSKESLYQYIREVHGEDITQKQFNETLRLLDLYQSDWDPKERLTQEEQRFAIQALFKDSYRSGWNPATWLGGNRITTEGRRALETAVHRTRTERAQADSDYNAYLEQMRSVNNRRATLDAAAVAAENNALEQIKEGLSEIRRSGQIITSAQERDRLRQTEFNIDGLREALNSPVRPGEGVAGSGDSIEGREGIFGGIDIGNEDNLGDIFNAGNQISQGVTGFGSGFSRGFNLGAREATGQDRPLTNTRLDNILASLGETLGVLARAPLKAGEAYWDVSYGKLWEKLNEIPEEQLNELKLEYAVYRMSTEASTSFEDWVKQGLAQTSK